ncbi:MAG: hypoxanthine phosphoribosyltransferase [Gemmataceae bacterium]
MRVLLSAEQIRVRIHELAAEIGACYERQPVTLLGVLTGSLMFVADLVRQLDLPLRIAFIQASSYRGTTTDPGELYLGPALIPDVRGRHVLLLDDILDTGRTLARVRQLVSDWQPASLKIAVLLRKQGRQVVPLEPDFCGFTIPNCFVVGYGLDYNDEYRHLPFVAVLDGSVTDAPESARDRT